MKIIKLFLAFVAIALVGGFGFLAFVDVPIAQQDVSKEIPHDRFSPQ